MVRSGEGHTDVRAPSVAPPPAHPTAHPLYPTLGITTKALPLPAPHPPKAIPSVQTRVHGYVSVGKEWGGAHRRARTLGGTPSHPPHRPPPSTQHLESPPKPCHSLTPPPKAIPSLHTRVHGYVSVGKEWGGAHRRARTLGGTPLPTHPTAHPLYPTLGITTKALPLPDPAPKGYPKLAHTCTRVCERW